jgi:hypothetical protein
VGPKLPSAPGQCPRRPECPRAGAATLCSRSRLSDRDSRWRVRKRRCGRSRSLKTGPRNGHCQLLVGRADIYVYIHTYLFQAYKPGINGRASSVTSKVIIPEMPYFTGRPAWLKPICVANTILRRRSRSPTQWWGSPGRHRAQQRSARPSRHSSRARGMNMRPLGPVELVHGGLHV